MDNDLVDFAMKCPVSLKLNNLANVVRVDENEPANKKNVFFQKSSDGKQILRKMMAKPFPSILQKHKNKAIHLLMQVGSREKV